jgi:hypothetical protein
MIGTNGCPMAIAKRYSVSDEVVSDRSRGGVGARLLYEPSNEEVWPIGRAILFWIGLSAVGWTAIAGLVG